MTPAIERYIERLLAEAERISGVRDLNAQETPPSSGYQFELQMFEDDTRLGPVKRSTAYGVAECFEWSEAMNEQFGSTFPRVLGLDDSSMSAKAVKQGQAAAAALVDLKALENGTCRVVVDAGSGESRLPAARQEALAELVKVLPSGPATAEFALEQSTAIRNNTDYDRYIDALKAEQQQANANAQQPTSVAMMKAQSDQQSAQLQMQVAQNQAQQEQQVDQARAAIEVHQTQMERRRSSSTRSSWRTFSSSTRLRWRMRRPPRRRWPSRLR